MRDNCTSDVLIRQKWTLSDRKPAFRSHQCQLSQAESVKLHYTPEPITYPNHHPSFPFLGQEDTCGSAMPSAWSALSIPILLDGTAAREWSQPPEFIWPAATVTILVPANERRRRGEGSRRSQKRHPLRCFCPRRPFAVPPQLKTSPTALHARECSAPAAMCVMPAPRKDTTW